MFSLNFLIRWIVAPFIIIASLFAIFYFTRTHLSVLPDYKSEGVANIEEWIVSFGQEVQVMNAGITPEVSGEWYVRRGFFGISVLGFRPNKGFIKGITYRADITIARSYNDTEIIDLPQIKFSISPAPGIVSLVVDEGKKKTSTQPLIELVTDGRFAGKILTPIIVGQQVTFDEIKHEDRRMVWRPKQELPQGARFDFQVSDENKEIVMGKSFETVMEPKILNFFAKEPIIPGDKIIISFNVPMPATSSPITFNVHGAGAWIDPLTYEYIVSDVSAGKTYTAKFLANTRSADGGTVTRDSTYTLVSPGYAVASFADVAPKQSIYSPIEISFNQPVEKKSAENAFRISPSAKGTLSWQGEKMIFTPTKLAYQQNYTASVEPGIKAKFGLPSKEKANISFITAPEVYKLDVPYFKQEYSRSCEAATLRMALAYYGIVVHDMDILQKIGYSPRPKDYINNEWDDPRVMFVGDASKSNGDGYGVYGEPIARAAKDFGRNASYTTKITPQFIAKNVRSGSPVILWGYTSLVIPKTTWRVPGGGEVAALSGEHTRLVVGVYGSVANPIGFYLHDSLSGRQYEYWDANDLMEQVNAVPGVTDQAVVVG